MKNISISYNFYDKNKDLDSIKLAPVIVKYIPYSSKLIDGQINKLIFYYDGYESIYEYYIYKDISILSTEYYSY